MSFSAAHDAKEQVRQAVDIVDLVGGYLELRRQGRHFVALCPWHDDSRPSLQVNPERQSWKCWVCDIGGDVFSFIMQREGVDFPEALRMLAERAGIPLAQQRQQAPVEPGSPDDKQTLFKAAAWAEQQYHGCLLRHDDAAAARQYLTDRGISAESIEGYRIGFVPDRWQWILDRAGSTPFSPAVLEAIGLVAKSPNSGRPYDRFRGRVIFPIRDAQRRTIAFGGRIMPGGDEKGAKYINSPETRLFRKSEQLYGLDIVRDAVAKSRQVVVVEGYTDVVMARQFGLDNVVAVLGTALTPLHVRLLRRYADRITLLLDGDQAGQRRANEVLELFVAQQIDLRIVTLPEGLDPCDFIQQRGVDTMREQLAAAVDALEHRIRVVTHGVDLLGDTHRANVALQGLLTTIAKAPRLDAGTTTAVRLREQQLLTRLARQFQVDEHELRSQLSALRRRGQSASTTAAPSPPTDVEPLDPYEQELFEVLAVQPAAAATVLQAIAPNQLRTSAARQLYQVYEQLIADGQEPSTINVMTQLEDVPLKSQVLRLAEQAETKSAQDPQQRVDELLAAFARRQYESERRQSLAASADAELDQQEETQLFEQMLNRERNRQGLSAPTDG